MNGRMHVVVDEDGIERTSCVPQSVYDEEAEFFRWYVANLTERALAEVAEREAER
ncbi:MAG: hypothetical protein WAU52_14890 [Burkholderiales bacterium]